MKRPLEQWAEIAQKAVAIGSELIKSTRPQTITEKSDRDTVTNVDIQIERRIRGYLAEATPEAGFIGEEEGRQEIHPNPTFTWALDPIDGTANFVHGVPLSAVQVALLDAQGKACVAAISLPYLDMKYWAAHQLGAYAGSTRIYTSGVNDVAKSIISIGDYATGENAVKKNSRRVKLTSALAQEVERIRMFGSAAHDLAWVAEGRVDGAVILSNSTLDIAAGALIAQEAGAKVTDSKGEEYSVTSHDIVASAPQIHKRLIDIVPAEDRP